MDGQNVSAMPRLRATPAEGRSVAPDPGHHAAPVMRHGSMELRWFTPNGADPQTPHDRDELYFVTAGTGVLMRAAEAVPFEDDTRLTAPSEERVSFVAGDVLSYDYATSDGCDYDEFECACGAVSCRGKITGYDWMLPELQIRYRGHFSPYLAARIASLAAIGAERRAFSY